MGHKTEHVAGLLVLITIVVVLWYSWATATAKQSGVAKTASGPASIWGSPHTSSYIPAKQGLRKGDNWNGTRGPPRYPLLGNDRLVID